MPELRTRPDIDQLRRLARELLRAAKAGDEDAQRRLRSLDAPTTLAGAQLVLARDHGFASWARLKEEVDRRAAAPLHFVIRRVRSYDELVHLWGRVDEIFGRVRPEPPSHWHVMDDFDAKRTTMLRVEHDGRVVGGAIQLKLVALEPWARGIGLGRRLVQTVEAELLSVGHPLGAHADSESTGFFLRLGYNQRGKSHLHMYKSAPSPRVLERRLDRWRLAVGDLDAGVSVEVDPATGVVPPLPW